MKDEIDFAGYDDTLKSVLALKVATLQQQVLMMEQRLLDNGREIAQTAKTLSERVEAKATEVAKRTSETSVQIVALERELIAMDRRFEDARKADMHVAKTMSETVEAKAVAVASLLEEKLSGVDNRLAERVESLDKALTLQAEEYARRLGSLDRGHEKLDKALDDRLPREVFDRFDAENRPWRGSVDKELNIQRGKDNGKSVMVSLGVSLLAVVVAILSIIIGQYGFPHHP